MLWVLQDPELIGIVPPLVYLVFLAVVMRFWQPKNIYREPTAPTLEELSAQDEPTYTLREVASAWSPFIFLSITILLWSTVLRPVFDHNGALGFANLSFHVPGIHHQIGDGEGSLSTQSSTGTFWVRRVPPFWWRLCSLRSLRKLPSVRLWKNSTAHGSS